jgi:hypothetical protein
MPRRRLVRTVLLLCVALAACDATPSDPLDARGDLAALLALDGEAGRQAPLTLPGLLHAAVHKVYSEQGATAARSLVSELRRLQEESSVALARGDRERAAALTSAAHAEQIALVLRVFGRGVLERVITGVALDAARLARGVAETEAAGRELPRARELLASIEALLGHAAAAAAQGSPERALEAATRAAALAESVRHALTDARRIPALQDLFDLAAAHLRTEVGPDAAREALADYNALRRAAEEAIRSGDRARAHEALEAVRAEQIRLVLHVLGAEAVERLLAVLSAGAGEVQAALTAARGAGRDVTRLERMAVAANDMIARARAAADGGDAAAALDLASHAAGLMNSIRLALTFR